MSFAKDEYLRLKREIPEEVTIVAVSKTKPLSDLQEAYEFGVRDFGENYVQELVDKYDSLPKDIQWHFIGHLQTNKVKYIASFVHLIHGVDSEKLLSEINKQGKKLNRKINCLLQMHIASEETKFGMDEQELHSVIDKLSEFEFINVCGLMGMASFSDDEMLIKSEFSGLDKMYKNIKSNPQTPNLQPNILSMGMSADYPMAISCGSNMIRIGSMLFGSRSKQ